MKLNKVLFGIMFTASAVSALAVAKAPVIDVNAPSIDNSALVDKIDRLTRKLDSRNRAQVNVQRQLDELQSEVNELRGVTELHTHQLGQLLERQKDLYKEIERRMSQVLVPNSATPTPTPVANTAKPEVAAVPVSNYSNNLTENEAYDRALNLVLKDKQYKQAIVEFQNFNTTYPKSSYAANSHYWLGQLLFNQGDIEPASTEFLTIVDNYKESAKRPDALLKLAMIAQKQADNVKAKSLYQQLISEYPNATATKLAKPRLEDIAK